MGGRERALSLLNTAARSWYMGGTQDRPGEKGVTSPFSLRRTSRLKTGLKTMISPIEDLTRSPVKLRIIMHQRRMTQDYWGGGVWGGRILNDRFSP